MTYYSKIEPIQLGIPADRQSARRHYGVHPYFTRRPYNVVRDYILRYSREGDRVLDPFGGSGVTAIEAFIENRIGIQNDINPLANFIARGITDLQKGEIADYKTALLDLKRNCKSTLDELPGLSLEQLDALKRRLRLPEDVILPSSSDVRAYHELFSVRQLVALSFLKEQIDRIRGSHPRAGMLLAWSATLAKINRTFLSAEGRAESRGGSSIFSIYRYKVAKEPIELPPWKTFEERAQNVISAKAEIDRAIEFKRRTTGWSGKFEVYARDVEELHKTLDHRVDYIFTDPPYGGHISYLDLSTLWNAWLGKLPNRKTREHELIVGGELDLSESNYVSRLGASIKACLDLLKRDRWMSVVFQHWNTDYFDAILSSAAESGADLRAAVPQVGDTIWSMHKKKGNESVLAGELILSFYKSGVVAKLRNRSNRFDIDKAVRNILSRIDAPIMYGEHLFNQLIVKAWNEGAIGSIHITKHEFNDLIKKHGWQYDEQNHRWMKEASGQMLFSSIA